MKSVTIFLSSILLFSIIVNFIWIFNKNVIGIPIYLTIICYVDCKFILLHEVSTLLNYTRFRKLIYFFE